MSLLMPYDCDAWPLEDLLTANAIFKHRLELRDSTPAQYPIQLIALSQIAFIHKQLKIFREAGIDVEESSS